MGQEDANVKNLAILAISGYLKKAK